MKEWRVVSQRERSSRLYRFYQTESGARARVQRLEDTKKGMVWGDNEIGFREEIPPLEWVRMDSREVGPWEECS